MNTIQWTAKAARQLRRIADKATRQRIYQDAQTLADFPHCANIKKLTNAQHPYRLRVGNWRVFFTFDGEIRIVTIKEVKPRNERTY
jgi:mRNA-degrading endonuclease RelE of RelBE toxin-antitoxin system